MLQQQNQMIDYQQLAMAMLNQATTKAAGSTPSGYWGHGPGGVFSHPGLSQQVFNAMLLPHLGLQRLLPVRLSNDTNPLFGIMTGVTAGSGDNPTNVCDDFPSAGLMKLCMHSSVFARIGLDTNVYNIDRAGEQVNRGEFLDLQLLGNPVQNGANMPTIPGFGGAAGALQNEAQKALFETAVEWSRRYAALLYTGNPSNNTSGGGYKEYYGLEALVNTGYQDAENAQACPAADSIVYSFGSVDITNANSDIVGVIQDIFFRLKHLAARTGLGQVRWVMSMPLGMFYRLSEVWAYYYFSRALDGLTFNSSLQANLGIEGATAFRDQMRGNLETRTGQFLMIDGQRIDVILDDAIPETEYTPGQFTSDIYFIPLTVLGGTPVTFMEYFNFNAPGGSMDMARALARAEDYQVSDNGMYLWHKKPPTNWCVEATVLSKPRLILRTPYIAARITDVLWSPLSQHERSPFTSSAYFANGGRTDRIGYGPSFYAPTS